MREDSPGQECGDGQSDMGNGSTAGTQALQYGGPKFGL